MERVKKLVPNSYDILMKQHPHKPTAAKSVYARRLWVHVGSAHLENHSIPTHISLVTSESILKCIMKIWDEAEL